MLSIPGDLDCYPPSLYLIYRNLQKVTDSDEMKSGAKANNSFNWAENYTINYKGHPAFLNVKNELTRLMMDQSAHSQEGQLLESDAKYDTQPNYLYRNYINIALEMTHYLKICHWNYKSVRQSKQELKKLPWNQRNRPNACWTEKNKIFGFLRYETS